MNESVGGWLSRLRRSRGASLAAIVALGLVLQLPISMIGGLILEREQRRATAVEDISSKWGSQQLVTGPVLVVPYLAAERSARADGTPVVQEVRRAAVFLPDRLAVDASLDAQTRSRGIFDVPVYRLSATVSGAFAAPDFGFLSEPPVEVYWNQAQVALGVSDVRAIQQQPSLAWGEATVPFEPGPGGFAFEAFGDVEPPGRSRDGGGRAALSAGRGIHAVLPPGGADGREFSFPLALNGTGGLRFVPMGRTTDVTVRSNSPNPSFQGAWLPKDRRVDGGGFEAAWSIPYLGRGYAQAWDAAETPSALIDQSAFGVTLVEPVDPYRMAERSIKYASLFVVLTFAAVWVIEVVGARRVHWIQYLLVGAALCMFFLLELSLAEHIGFDLAYLLAAAGVVGMIAAYGRAVFGSWRLAALVGTGVALLYGYLYLLLINEDYSLLGGSVGLFAMLAAAMYATRKVDWYGVAGDPGGRAA